MAIMEMELVYKILIGTGLVFALGYAIFGAVRTFLNFTGNFIKFFLFLAVLAVIVLIVLSELKENNVDTSKYVDKAKDAIGKVSDVIPDISDIDVDVKIPKIKIKDNDAEQDDSIPTEQPDTLTGIQLLWDAAKQQEKYQIGNSDIGNIPADSVIQVNEDRIEYASGNLIDLIESIDNQMIYSINGRYIVSYSNGFYFACINDALYRTNYLNIYDFRNSVAPRYEFTGIFNLVQNSCGSQYEELE